VIAFLEGEVAHKAGTTIVLDVHGVGYEVLVPASTVAKLPPVGKRARVQTRMVVRDDSMTLFGFATTDERELFDLLVTVTGVGPKVALSFLSVLTPDTLRRQAEVARAAGRSQLADNLDRAAELTGVPDDELLAVYTALRPGRSNAAALEEWARRLEAYGAVLTAAFVREAGAAYADRGLLGA